MFQALSPKLIYCRLRAGICNCRLDYMFSFPARWLDEHRTCAYMLMVSTLSIESKEKIMERACQIQEVPYDTICIYLLRGVKLGAVTQARDLKMFFMNGGWTIWPCHLLSFSTSITTVTNTGQPEHHDYTMKWRKSPVTIFIFIDAKTWVMAHKVTWGWCSMNTRLIWVFKIC